MKRVSVTTLGCKTNQFESAAMIEQLQNAGYRVVPFSEPADICIINSCTVTARTDAETRRLIRRARRLNPLARIVATGCYAQVSPGELEQMPELDGILGNREKKSIAALLESERSLVSDIAGDDGADSLTLASFAEHTRAFLQVQNGCDSYCSYCIVPYARGRSRSVPSGEVLEGIGTLAANGYKEVVLTGIHLGAYGLDLSPPSALTALMRSIVEARIVPRLRIGSVEPNEVSTELLNLMSGSDCICPHLHLPLQSGSGTVLQRMGRHYTGDFFRRLIADVNLALPDAFIGADVIAGFPGESDAEFAETVELLTELPVSDLHVFPYSRRPGTTAAGMPGHLPPQLITERAALLREMARQKKNDFMRRFIGRGVDVLIQGHDRKTGILKGLSRNYLTVTCPGGSDLVNSEVQVLILGKEGERCTGVIAS
ncbi:MAG TPA: tRNA (N(6)-L-threonylcarbamoyladenosine(37)-C(2))-methylthiotransferase MtaB [Desulfuromonadales bacterium]|nr:tRNA (N(6)-L-threonylcarbamoyladenosine(37)-C(2))-methylthiotransferase MtaB [Desulfuromonadales bacterium]